MVGHSCDAVSEGDESPERGPGMELLSPMVTTQSELILGSSTLQELGSIELLMTMTWERIRAREAPCFG